MYLRGVHYTFSLCVNISIYDWRMSDYLILGNVFCPSPKHMIRLSVNHRQDSTILIRLCKSLVGDTPYIYIYIYIYIKVSAGS